MSEKKHRHARAVERLACTAHDSVHLLANLADAIAEPAVATMCRETATRLEAALSSVVCHREKGKQAHQEKRVESAMTR